MKSIPILVIVIQRDDHFAKARRALRKSAANERESINALIEKVVGAIYEVANVLGAGFLGVVNTGQGTLMFGAVSAKASSSCEILMRKPTAGCGYSTPAARSSGGELV